MNIDSDRPDENPPEIEIEIEPASGSDAPPPSEVSSPEPPVFDDLPDLPPVPDGDLADLPEIPDDDLGGLPDVPEDPPGVSVEPDVIIDPVEPPEPVEPPKPVVGKLTLQSVANPGQELTMSVSTKVGKHLCRTMGEDSKFMDTMQMELEKADSGWQVKPNASAQNETLLNGSAVVGVQPLKEGDVLSVGREAKGVSKMEMRVSFP